MLPPPPSVRPVVLVGMWLKMVVGLIMVVQPGALLTHEEPVCQLSASHDRHCGEGWGA